MARPRPTYLPIGTFIHLAVWPQQTWDENRVGGGLYPFRYGELHGSPSNTLWPGPRPISLPSGILIHPTVSPQQARAENWGLCLFGGKGAVSPSNTVWRGQRLRPYQAASCIQPYGHKTWPKIWRVEAVPFGGGELGPHLTQFGEDRVLPPR